MFGNQNKNTSPVPASNQSAMPAVNPPAGPVPAANQDQIKIHTMQDHLDMLAGKAPMQSGQSASALSGVDLNQAGFSGGAAVAKARPVQSGSSPFLGPVRIAEGAAPKSPAAAPQPPSGPKPAIPTRVAPTHIPIGQPPVKIQPDAQRPAVIEKPEVPQPFQETSRASLYQNLPETLNGESEKKPELAWSGTQEFANLMAKSNVQTPVQAPIKPASAVTPSGGSRKKIVAAVSLVILVCLAAASYFFWSTRYARPEEEVIVGPAEPETPPSEPVEPETPVKKYSTDKPNYWRIENFGTMSGGEFKAAFGELAAEVVGESPAAPVELLVTDSGNNPVAFRDFAKTADLKIPAAILDELSGRFSLFVFRDGSNVRIGLAVEAKPTALTGDKLPKLVRGNEKVLADALATLFLGEAYQVGQNVFNDGVYGKTAIRYQNLNASFDLSVDYTFQGNQWVIGTSKNMIRVVLDKLAAAVPAAPSAAGSDTSAVK